MRHLSILLHFIVAASIVTDVANAQSGMLDSSFGVDGVMYADLFGTNEYGYNMVQQSDGKFVVVGNTTPTDDSTYIIAVRYKQNGTIDSSFSDNGIFTYNTESTVYETGKSVLLQSDEKILLCCSLSEYLFKFMIIRLNTDGTLDSSYADNGVAILNFLDYYSFVDITSATLSTAAIQPDDKVIVAGTLFTFNEDVIAARFNVDGAIDTTFGNDGLAVYDLGTIHENILDISLQTDGKIVMSGKYDAYSYTDFLTMRLNPNGSIDSTFGTAGITAIDLSGNTDFATSVAIQADNKIVTGGKALYDFGDRHVVVRYHSDGTLDPDFGEDGVVILPSSGTPRNKFHVAIMENQQIITVEPHLYNWTISRFNSDGSSDTTFGIGGKTTLPLDEFYLHEVHDLIIQFDGRILALGSAYLANTDIALVRLNNCGASFKIYPDTLPHTWNALNMAFGVEPMDYIWDWGDGVTSTGGYPSHVYADSGYYNICLSIADAAGCSASYCDSSTYIYKNNAAMSMVWVNVVAELPEYPETGISVESNKLPSIYPNPFDNELIIERLTNEEAIMTISDSNGKILLQNRINNTVEIIDMRGIPPGLYFLIYRDAYGVSTFKIIKK